MANARALMGLLLLLLLLLIGIGCGFTIGRAYRMPVGAT